MTWERSVLDLLDDLEQQAAGLSLRERELEVDDRGRAAYARVSLASRCHASVGTTISVRLIDETALTGTLARTGADWLLVRDDGGREWVVPQRAVVLVDGLSTRSVAPEATGVVNRLSLVAVLRRLIDAAGEARIQLASGPPVTARIRRVGADFVEVDGPTGPRLLPLSVIVTVRS